MNETWKDLPIYGKHSKYQVSNFGNLRKINIKYGIELDSRPLKICLCKDGVPTIALRNNGKSRSYDVAHLVANAFLENPKGYIFLKHIDGNKQNNAVDNLMWIPKYRLFGNSKKKASKLVERTIEWLYDQLNNGRMECGDMEAFINDYKESMLESTL